MKSLVDGNLERLGFAAAHFVEGLLGSDPRLDVEEPARTNIVAELRIFFVRLC
ncbi:MAG: hypothetical protein AMXMBFR4_22390 [Candidatus Hydrogenedentota bacterium]